MQDGSSHVHLQLCSQSPTTTPIEYIYFIHLWGVRHTVCLEEWWLQAVHVDEIACWVGCPSYSAIMDSDKPELTYMQEAVAHLPAAEVQPVHHSLLECPPGASHHSTSLL